MCTELTNVKGTKRSKENKEPKPKVANQADTNRRRRKTGFWNKLGERIYKVEEKHRRRTRRTGMRMIRMMT